MKKHNGVISDRLRKLFGSSDTAYTPPRPSDSKPMPKTGVKGTQLSKPDRKSKR